MSKMKLLRWMMLASIVALMTGCGVNRVGVEYCAHAKPIWFNDQTEKAMTPAPVKRQVLENNETVQRLCG